jgi:hypothetical protein
LLSEPPDAARKSGCHRDHHHEGDESDTSDAADNHGGAHLTAARFLRDVRVDLERLGVVLAAEVTGLKYLLRA